MAVDKYLYMASESQLVNFYSKATQLGFARDNLFRLVEMQGTVIPNEDLIYLKSATVPSKAIKTGKLHYKNFAFNVPFGATYPESTNWRVTFYSDSEYLIREALMNFSLATFNETDFTRSQDTFNTIEFELCRHVMLGEEKIELPKGIDFYGATNPISETKDKRLPEEKINSVKLEPIIKYKLYGCYPVNIGGITYNTTSTGSLVTVEANIAYQYVESEYIR